jgi:hypothetical protein
MSENQVDRRRGGRRQSDVFIKNLSDELDIIIEILDGKLDATAREILEVRSLQFQLGRRRDDRETEAEIMRKLERISKALCQGTRIRLIEIFSWTVALSMN